MSEVQWNKIRWKVEETRIRKLQEKIFKYKIRRGAACVERRTSGSEVGVRGRLRTYYNRLPWKQSANKIMLIG